MKRISFPFQRRLHTSLIARQCFSQQAIESTTHSFVDVEERAPHTPVLLDESIQFLKPEPGQLYIDMTFGAGGHTTKILDECDCKVITLDRDPVAFARAQKLTTKYPGRLTPLLGRFSELPGLLASNGIKQNSLDGFLFDFGCSSMQMDTANRGFAISKDGPLDMRMDSGRYPDQLSAKDILALAGEGELTKIFKIYGDEKKAAKIARTIVDARYMFKKIETTKELVEVVNSVCKDEVRHDMLNRYTSNATKVFQALRIFVNNELNEINYAMVIARRYLKLNGRLVTISFHSLEDTIVKRHIAGNLVNDVANPVPLRYWSPALIHDKNTMFQFLSAGWESLTKHVITPSIEEVERNPRSRSAKMRAAIKIA